MQLLPDAAHGRFGSRWNVVSRGEMQSIQMIKPVIIDCFPIMPDDWSVIFVRLVAFMLTLQLPAVAQYPISHLSLHHCSFHQGNRVRCALT